MKQLFTIFLVFATSMVARAQFNQEALMKSEMARYEQLRLFKKSMVGDNYELVYHRIHWNINPHKDSMSGIVTTYFITRSDNFTSVGFDFINTMQVDSVYYHGTNTTFTHNSDIILADVTSMSANTLDSITIFYSGNPVLASVSNGAYAREKRRPLNDHPVVWTLSQPYGAMYWWPCKQTLSDKIDSLDIYVTVPQGNKAASNGLLVDSLLQDTFVTYHWKHRYPIVTYLVAVAVTNYEEFSDWYHFENGDSMEILNYLYPESVANMREHAKSTLRVMHTFDSLFGTYPFAREKYGHAQFGRGGGMEHQTMSFMVDLNFELLSHELAHQWFGNATTCRSWSDIWLNEGFATFLTILSYEVHTPRDMYRTRAGQTRDAVMKENDGSVFVQDTLDRSRLFSSRLTYHKGAMLLQMLRYRLGDSIFYAATKEYLESPGIKYGFARTDDLKWFLEKASGEDLTLFFDQWFYKEGFPIIDVTWRRNGSLYEINLAQTTSHASVVFFDTPLPVQFIGEDADTIICFRADEADWTNVFSLPFDPVEVVVDPDVRILARTNLLKGNDLAGKVTLYPNPVQDVLIFSSTPFAVSKVEIFDVTGSLIIEHLLSDSGQNYGQLNISQLTNGLYFIRISGGGQTVDTRFVKQ